MSDLTTTAVSRRKQQKPARVVGQMPSNAQCSSTPSPTSVIVRTSDLESVQQTKQNQQNLRPGIHNEECSKCHQGKDIAGRLKLCSLDENGARGSEVIRIANTANGANCELLESGQSCPIFIDQSSRSYAVSGCHLQDIRSHTTGGTTCDTTDDNLYIRINRPVQKMTDLRAKYFSTPSTPQQEGSPNENGSPSTASSASPSNLSASDIQNAPVGSSSDLSLMTMTPHAIYLPVAFHNAGTSHMQVVGYPQIVIPVAVNRTTAHLYKPSLFVDEALSRGLDMPSSLTIGGTLIKVDKVTYPSNTTTDTSPEPLSTSKSPKSRVSSTCRAGTKRHTPSDGNKPLDLSVHVKEKRPTVHTNPDSTSSQSSPLEPEKRYRCECGVSFNNETTLLGHRKYYCNSNANPAEITREPHKKAVTRCQQCDFQPASANQLAQHIRANHSAVKAYVCQLCGYKGYSQRGIRSHLRTHAECSGSHNEELMRRHVDVVTPETEKIECGECHKSFDTKQLMKQHECLQTVVCDSM